MKGIIIINIISEISSLQILICFQNGSHLKRNLCYSKSHRNNYNLIKGALAGSLVMLEHLKFEKGKFQELFPSHLPKIQQ